MADRSSGDMMPVHRGGARWLDSNAALGEVYAELRAAAARMLRRDAPSLTLQPTELANEAALRIARLERMSWNDRQHFFATGARIMRQAMLDAVRSRRAAKRQAPEVMLDGDLPVPVEIDLLDAALTKLERESPELARIVELRFFVGLPVDQIAVVLDASPSTVKRRWQAARLWLADELGLASTAQRLAAEFGHGPAGKRHVASGVARA